MYDNWLANATVVGATILTVVAAVLVHYEGLIYTARAVVAYQGKHRVRVLFAISFTILLHVVEMWLFGLVMWALLQRCDRRRGRLAILRHDLPLGDHRIRAHRLVGVFHVSRDGALLEAVRDPPLFPAGYAKQRNGS